MDHAGFNGLCLAISSGDVLNGENLLSSILACEYLKSYLSFPFWSVGVEQLSDQER
jgi:hypothetical protein